jgi:hypothetical protein
VTRGALFAVLFAAAGLIAAAQATPGQFGGLKEIEAFSDASSRGDQAAMTALLADQMLFSAGDGAVQREPKFDRNDPTTVLIKKQTQTLRDAAAKGDRAAIDPLLDEELIYVNEDGAVSGRHDFRLGAAIGGTNPGAATVKLQDWVAHKADGVVVSTYTTDTVTRYGEQSFEERALAVDAWIKRGASWKLIESQIIPLNQDPPVAPMQAAALDDYAGVYAAAPNFRVSVSRDGDGLALSTNGGKPVAVAAEAKDVFFVPGLQSGVRRSRIVFQRDAGGAIDGYVSSRGLALKRIATAAAANDSADALKVTSSVAPASDLVVHRAGALAVTSFIHDRVTQYPGQLLHTRYRSTESWTRQGGVWKMLTLQSLELPVDPRPAPLSPGALDDYVGDYAAAAGVSVKFARTGEHLDIAQTGEKPQALEAMAKDAFFVPGQPRNTLLFQRDATGRLLGYFLRREGHDLAFRRL